MQHGRYTVNRKLAEGGMAEIFLAKQHGSQGFEKPVVLKRIHAALYADEQFRNMLIDEAHISMGLMHNNIVQILDLGQAGGRYFLVLELIEGWDLGKLIRRAGDLGVPVPPELGLYIVAQVCRALGYAHGKTNPEGRPLGIVHRDVSPQNVLISDQGDVKLADFGIAKARLKRDSTNTGVVKGKIAFMSPEQALGLELDARSDLYSLGTLLYLLVLGRRPFEGASDLEVLLRVQKGELTSPTAIKPDLHPAVAGVIERAMQFDRDQRYGSADEMLADLEGALRSAFASAGQTELKHWLAELSRLDGEMPIGRNVVPDEASDSLDGAPELGSGDDLVLVEEVEPTLLREPPLRKERSVRVTGAEATVADLRIAPTWIDQETPVAIRSTAPSRLGSVGVMMVITVALAATAAGVWIASKNRNASVPTEAAVVNDKAAAIPTVTDEKAAPAHLAQKAPPAEKAPLEAPTVATPPKTEAGKPEVGNPEVGRPEVGKPPAGKLIKKPAEISPSAPSVLPGQDDAPSVAPPSVSPTDPLPVPAEPPSPPPAELPSAAPPTVITPDPVAPTVEPTPPESVQPAPPAVAPTTAP